MTRFVKLTAYSGNTVVVLFNGSEKRGYLWDHLTDSERAMVNFAFEFTYNDCVTTHVRPATGVKYETISSSEEIK